jgi:D-lactate dehydrogenase (cytochrome)
MMPGGPTSALQQLIAQLGTDVIVTDPEVLAGVSVDHRKLYEGRALALALPRDTAQVSRLLSLCNALRIPVVPQGGNTGYCAAATPDDSATQLVVSLRRMNAIREVQPANDSITVEAGCILADVQRRAADAGRFFPLSLGAQGSCHIGGNLSTNAGGVNVLRYGMMRDLVLGLEVVLADGRVLSSLAGLRKDNTGYDLRHLFIGAEGTLGIITAATLKLFPASRAVATALVALPNPAAAVTLLGQLRRGCGDLVSSFELIPRIGLELVNRHLPDTRVPLESNSPWYVLCELSSAGDEPLQERLETLLGNALESGLLTDATLAQNERERQSLWFLRENIPEGQRRDGPSLKHDVSIPIDRIAEFVERAGDWVQEHVPEGFLVCYGHVGDGNLHFNINQSVAGSTGGSQQPLLAREPQVRRAIHDLVAEYGGSFSAEHGIGRHKVAELERYASPVELDLMHAIKRVFDPNGIMNPGKVLNGG